MECAWGCSPTDDTRTAPRSQILNDADLNIQSIPDSVEKQIYLSTVKIALNAVYKGLSSLHGMDVVGHKMIVRRLESLGAVSGIVREVARHHEVNASDAPDALPRVFPTLLRLFRLLRRMLRMPLSPGQYLGARHSFPCEEPHTRPRLASLLGPGARCGPAARQSCGE